MKKKTIVLVAGSLLCAGAFFNFTLGSWIIPNNDIVLAQAEGVWSCEMELDCPWNGGWQTKSCTGKISCEGNAGEGWIRCDGTEIKCD